MGSKCINWARSCCGLSSSSNGGVDGDLSSSSSGTHGGYDSIEDSERYADGGDGEREPLFPAPEQHQHPPLNLTSQQQRIAEAANSFQFDRNNSSTEQSSISPEGLLQYTLRLHKNAHIMNSLTGFIEAHEYAQKKIAYYLGQSESLDTLETMLVVKESEAAVQRAKARLRNTDPQEASVNISQQAVRWILHMEEDLLEEMQHEGILSPGDAEVLTADIDSDFRTLEQEEWVLMFQR